MSFLKSSIVALSIFTCASAALADVNIFDGQKNFKATGIEQVLFEGDSLSITLSSSALNSPNYFVLTAASIESKQVSQKELVDLINFYKDSKTHTLNLSLVRENTGSFNAKLETLAINRK